VIRQARPGRPGYERPPWFLALVALVWIGTGVMELLLVRFSFHILTGIVFIGVGVLWARGALVGLLRSRGLEVPAPQPRRRR
jgi:hypothetical protein